MCAAMDSASAKEVEDLFRRSKMEQKSMGYLGPAVSWEIKLKHSTKDTIWVTQHMPVHALFMRHQMSCSFRNQGKTLPLIQRAYWKTISTFIFDWNRLDSPLTGPWRTALSVCTIEFSDWSAKSTARDNWSVSYLSRTVWCNPPQGFTTRSAIFETYCVFGHESQIRHRVHGAFPTLCSTGILCPWVMNVCSCV